MKNLAFSKKFIFTLFAVLIGVNLWGQGTRDLIDLDDCTITIHEDVPYLYTTSNVTIELSDISVWYYDYDLEEEVDVTSECNITIGDATLDNEHPITKGVGKYQLTVTDKNDASNTNARYFYVLPGESDYYTISNETEWNRFADCVKDGYSFDGLTVKLTTSSTITVSTMVANETYPFSGTFDGNFKTLEVYYIGNGYLAPFYYTEGATIKDLTVTGCIKVTEKQTYGYLGNSAGLICSTTYDQYDVGRNTKVKRVTVSVNITGIDSNYNEIGAGDYCGGFSSYSSYLEFEDCVYNGKIFAGSNSGGFCGNDQNSYATFEDCVFNPADGSSITSGNTFGTVADATDITGCYYTDNLGTTTQGKIAYAYDGIPGNTFVKKVKVNNTIVYGKVTVSGIDSSYPYDGTNLYSSIKSAVTLDDAFITENDTIFTIKKNSVEVHEVIESGTYNLTIAGQNTTNYPTTYSKTFSVVSDLSGSGTELDPYIIATEGDWIRFAYNVNNGNSYLGKYLKLTNNISVSTMVGTAIYQFKGNFDGDDKTLTFNYGTSETPTTDVVVAPFRYTNGANIHNLTVAGEIHTNVGKEAGLIGINVYNSSKTTVFQVTVAVDFYCYEVLWDAEGGGFAYDGGGVDFSSCGYVGKITANNYHGGICGNADPSTTFTRCLFNPAEEGLYWAENIVYNNDGATISPAQCFYTVGNNQEESEQGTLVYVVYAEHPMPDEIIGKKLTTFYGRDIYKPVNVVISGVNKRYTYTGSEITINPTVKFDNVDALNYNYCTWAITPSPVLDKGLYTFTVTAPKAGVDSDYLGSKTQSVRVVDPESTDWADLQAQLSGSASTITLTKNIIAGSEDVALVVESGREVTINLNGYKIDRGFYQGNNTWLDAVVGGHVLKVNSGATVVINGGTGGTITGGNNKAASTAEHGENNDGGGIFNMGSLTLNNVTLEYNRCEKKTDGVSRTARGGGIYSGSGSTLIINTCTITHNEAKGGGGGLYAEKAAVLMMDHATVQSNNSQDKGGGIRVDATNTKHYNSNNELVNNALIKDCEISSNTVALYTPESASNGGGIHLDAGTINLTHCNIHNNNASKYGGGIYMMGVTSTINAENCTIQYNKSYDQTNKFEGYGGGVCILGGTFKMVGGIVSGNSSCVSNGGGIFVASGKTLRLSGSVNITGNWKYNDISLGSTSTTNVYLVSSSGKIYIDGANGSFSEANVGVSKNGITGVFTSGLNGKGTIANFSSDNADYQILPSGNEAQIGQATPVTPPDDGTWTINSATILHTTVGNDVTGIVFGANGCLYVNEGGVINSTTVITNNDPNKLIINGGQVNTTTANVKATIHKEIQYATISGTPENWYLISSGISNPSITTNTNLITDNGNGYPTYDLYRFNESVTNNLQWENYRAGHADFTTLANGRGYLYRNGDDYTISISGELNSGDVYCPVTCTPTVNTEDNIFEGFNLIGNPYTHDITLLNTTLVDNDNNQIEDGEHNPINLVGFYRLTANGSTWTAEITSGAAATIETFEGFLVQVPEAAKKVKFSKTARAAAKSNGDNLMFAIANDRFKDVAYALFNDGYGLNKIDHMNDTVPMIYINQNYEDYAIAMMGDDNKQFNLNFEAKTLGMYTLTVNPQGNYSYLHLIDKVAEEDIDLLKENEYSFIGSPSDNADRFVVRLNNSESSDNSVFAYQSGNDIVVCGEGELSVFDVMGRLVAQKRVNGVESIDKPQTTGVYIIKLNDKTQKIVIN